VLNRELPSGWRWVTLGDVADPNGRAIVSGPFGSNIGSRFFVQEGVPVIRGNNLTTDMRRFIDDGFVFLTDEKAQELGNCEALPDDLVFTAAGSLGQVGIIPQHSRYPRYIISNKQLRARVDKRSVDPLFAFYCFSSPQMVEYVQQRNTGSSIPLINLGVLRSLPMPLPPLQEQRAIARVLGSLDDKIELNRLINETLEEIGFVFFTSWCLNPGGGKRAEGWAPGNIGSLMTESAERVGEIKDVVVLSAISSGEVVRSDDHFDKRVYSKDLAKYRLVRQWDFAYNPSRINIGSIGMSTDPVVGAVSPVYCVARPRKDYEWFLRFFLRLPQTKEYISQLCSGSVRQSLSFRDFASIPCVIPPHEVVQDFNRQYAKLREFQQSLKEQSRTLAALRDALLPKLLSGEVRVKQSGKAGKAE
jgi:type I restriction enzyme S subunit